jgi:hypothetical protein
LNLLKFALPERTELQTIESISPTDLRDRLISAGLAKPGEVFRSKKRFYDRAVKTISRFDSRVTSLEKYELLPLSEKTQLVDHVLSKGAISDKASLMLLLDHDYARARNALYAKFLDDLDRGKSSPELLAQYRSQKDELYANMQIFASPSTLVRSGSYGLPSPDEIASLKSSPFWEQAKKTMSETQGFQNALIQQNKNRMRLVDALKDLLNAVKADIKKQSFDFARSS